MRSTVGWPLVLLVFYDIVVRWPMSSAVGLTFVILMVVIMHLAINDGRATGYGEGYAAGRKEHAERDHA